MKKREPINQIQELRLMVNGLDMRRGAIVVQRMDREDNRVLTELPELQIQVKLLIEEWNHLPFHMVLLTTGGFTFNEKGEVDGVIITSHEESHPRGKRLWLTKNYLEKDGYDWKHLPIISFQNC